MENFFHKNGFINFVVRETSLEDNKILKQKVINSEHSFTDKAFSCVKSQIYILQLNDSKNVLF